MSAENEGVVIPIGANLTPIQQAFAALPGQARETGKAIGEGLGVEGLKGERALHGRLMSAIKDMKDAKDPAEALGGVLQNLGESFRMSASSMVAFAAVSALGDALYKGYVNVMKMRDGLKDALTITSDVSGKSVEKVRTEVERLRKDAEADNLAAMGQFEAGYTTFMQVIMEGKDASKVVREDAENYHRLSEEARQEEDAGARLTIDNENRILGLRVQGLDKEADALAKRLADEEKINAQKEKGHTETVAAIEKQIGLENDLEKVREAKKVIEEFATSDKEMSEEVAKGRAIGQTDRQKMDDLKDKLASEEGESRVNHAGFDTVEQSKLDLQIQKDLNAQKELQGKIDKSNLETFQKGNEADGKRLEKRKEILEEIATKTAEETEERSKLAEAAAAAMGFHGQVSSLRREGFGGRVGPNQNSEQLKAVAESNKHLGTLVTEVQKLRAELGRSI